MHFEHEVSEEERYLHQQLADLRMAYDKQAEPIVKRLMELQMVSGLRVVATHEEAAQIQNMQAVKISGQG